MLASPVPSAGAISIQSGVLLLTLRVYQIHLLGEKMWLEQGLIVFHSQAHWPSSKCVVKDGKAGRGISGHSGNRPGSS